MGTLRVLPLLAILLIGCNQDHDITNSNNDGECACNSMAREGSTYNSGRGALLGSRFSSFEALKSVIQIEYGGSIASDSTATANCYVRLRHCCNGRSVVNILAAGTSQGDILKARDGSIWDGVILLFHCPYAIMIRKDLGNIYNLSRRDPEQFGEGDPAFYDLAESSVGNINTPDLAFRNARDSTEKGYQNSFNHITAQAFITSCFSAELADFIGDSHERYRHPELIVGIFTDKQKDDLDEGPVDNYVDLINNKWGQELGNQLKEKYGINRETNWTPELLANYLNDLQRYYSWAFQIGFKPFNPEDEVVIRFSKKVTALFNDR